jgi:hypothetical protein
LADDLRRRYLAQQAELGGNEVILPGTIVHAAAGDTDVTAKKSQGRDGGKAAPGKAGKSWRDGAPEIPGPGLAIVTDDVLLENEFRTLPTLEAEFPDANLIFIHRDPCTVVASACRYILVTFIITMDYARVCPQRHGKRVLAALAAEAQRICTFSRAGSAAAQRAVHLRYEDVIADPLGTAEHLYAHFGYAWTADFETGIRHYLERNPQYKHGRPDYSLQAFGLDEASVAQAFCDYIHMFRSGSELLTAQPAGEPAPAHRER